MACREDGWRRSPYTAVSSALCLATAYAPKPHLLYGPPSLLWPEANSRADLPGRRCISRCAPHPVEQSPHTLPISTFVQMHNMCSISIASAPRTLLCSEAQHVRSITIASTPCTLLGSGAQHVLYIRRSGPEGYIFVYSPWPKIDLHPSSHLYPSRRDAIA